MPQPHINSVHVDAILTNISVAYLQNQDNFIADKVFPVIPVDKKSDKYFLYTKNDWFRDEAQRRAPGTESAGGGYNLSTATYSTDVYAFHKDVDDQTVANADAPLNPLREATEFVTRRLLLRRELQFVTDFFTTGVWADDVRALDEASHPDTIRPAKGVHLTVPWEKVRNDIAVVIPVPSDKRSLFVVPWISRGDGTYQFTYIGTTDTDYKGPVNDPQCTRDDIEYVLTALNASVNTDVTFEDVTGVWSGLRPLVKMDDSSAKAGRTADLSRRHRVFTSDNGVVTVTGGKLTTYREMAEDAVDAVSEVLGTKTRCRTKSMSLHGAKGRSIRASQRDHHLDGRFGSDAADIAALIANDPSLSGPLVDGLPYLRAEAVYAVTHEMATSIDDILSRRTRARLLNRRASVSAARATADLISPLLGWDDAQSSASIAEFIDACAREDAAAMVTEQEFIDSYKG